MVKSILGKLADRGHTSLSDAVYETLLEAIISGKFPSGATLSEVAVAKQLDVSRTPVHDALRQLSKDGLVVQATGRRARVASLSADDIFEIFEMRKFLEGPAAELAAGRMDERQLAPLRELATELGRTQDRVDWTARWADYDELFHETIAKASGNKRLAQDISRYRLLQKGFNKLATTPDVLQQALEEHRTILRALEAKDGAAAREAMVKHINDWQAYFIRNLTRPGN